MVISYIGSAATRSCEFRRSLRTFCDGLGSRGRWGVGDHLVTLSEKRRNISEISTSGAEDVRLVSSRAQETIYQWRPEITIMSLTVTYFVRWICSLTSSSCDRIRDLVEMADLRGKPFQKILQIGANDSLFLNL